MSEEEDPVAHKLYDELDELLRIFCSDAQQQFCIDQEVASRPQLHHIQQTMYQVQRFVPVVGLVGSTNADSLRHTLAVTALEMLDLYETACRQRRIRSMSPLQAEDLLLLWHELSQDYEDKTAEHAVFTRLLGDVSNLQNVWRDRPDHVESVVIALLSSSAREQGMYLATVDRHNYARLGLGRRSLGTRQLVFECRLTAREDQEKAIAGVCRRFAGIFMQNAQQNLEQLEAQRQQARPSVLAAKLRQLYDSIFHPPATNGTCSHPQTSTTTTAATAEDHHHHRHHYHKVTPFRLTSATTTPSFIWYPSDDDDGDDDNDCGEEQGGGRTDKHHGPIIGTIPAPSFVPAPWQWPDLLKPRTPYHPQLFGLMRGHKTTAAAAPFATVAVQQLCRHLSRVGQQFYQDVANNAKLGYHQDSRVLQGIGMDLVEMYKCLQLELSRQAMQQVMALLQQLQPTAAATTATTITTAAAAAAVSQDLDPSSSSVIQQDNTTLSTSHTHS